MSPVCLLPFLLKEKRMALNYWKARYLTGKNLVNRMREMVQVVLLPGCHIFAMLPFNVKFPFAYLDISDADLPFKVMVTGWSPFIPTDDDNSGLPVGAIEYKFTNTGKTTIEAVFSFNSKNFLKIDKGKNSIRSIQNGFILSEAGTSEKPYKTDFAIFTDDEATVVDHCWFRGGWWDPVTMAWNTVKNGEAKAVAPVDKDAPGASLFVPFTIAPGKEKTIRVMMAWYTPDSEQTYGKMGERKENCDPGFRLLQFTI